jgi:hypothetical protein
MADVSQILWSLVTSAVGSGLAAAIALQRYLDNQKRQDARSRYLDHGCDELAQSIAQALSTEAQRMEVASTFACDVGFGTVGQAARQAYLGTLGAEPVRIGGLSIPRTLRIVNRDPDLANLLGSLVRLIEISQSVGGPMLLSMLDVIEDLPDAERDQWGTRIGNLFMPLSRDLNVLLLNLPLIFEELGGAFTAALSADYEFDFDVAISRTRIALDGRRDAVNTIRKDIETAISNTRRNFREAHSDLLRSL